MGTEVKFCHSEHEEGPYGGEFDTRDEAIQDGLSEYDEGFYTGEVHRRTIGFYLDQRDIENMLESMAERAAEDCGEVADDWLSDPYIDWKMPLAERTALVIKIHDEKKESLASLLTDFRAALEKWATNNGNQPRFWHVDNVEPCDRKGE